MSVEQIIAAIAVAVGGGVTLWLFVPRGRRTTQPPVKALQEIIHKAETEKAAETQATADHKGAELQAALDTGDAQAQMQALADKENS